MAGLVPRWTLELGQRVAAARTAGLESAHPFPRPEALVKLLVFVCAVAVTTPVVAVTATQLAGRVDAPATAPPLQDALVGDWRGSLYVADFRTDFNRVDVAFRFSASGVVRIERGPYRPSGVSRPVQ